MNAKVLTVREPDCLGGKDSSPEAPSGKDPKLNLLSSRLSISIESNSFEVPL